MDQFSFIANAESGYIEALYRDYQNSPEQIDPEWSKFFKGFDFAVARFEDDETGQKPFDPAEFKAYNLIEAYRRKGHLIAKTNPIRERKDRHAGLSLKELGFEEADLQKDFLAADHLGLKSRKLADIIHFLEGRYASSLGFEVEYILKEDERIWWRNEIEGNIPPISIEKKNRILKKLNETVVFEQFLHKKYIGQKRFSLEGGENTIPALDAIINQAAVDGVEEVVIGMAHRGRLNVLANIMGKTYEQIFSEFEGDIEPDLSHGDGDVKYHLGYSSQIKTRSGEPIHVKLSPNPSHLEAVAPVVLGFARAKSDILYEGNAGKILPIIIHGDAAVAGQGVSYEVVQMSKLPGYETGGSIHFVINNQIGFTTDWDEARSSDYCTSVARIVDAPVIHVNGDHPEAVIRAVEMATRYRQQFGKDVFVDMVCYRKHGHNEGDDPKYTQPEMYKIIAGHKNPREIYTQNLLESGDEESKALSKKMEKEFWAELQDRLDKVKQEKLPYTYQQPEVAWRKLKAGKSGSDFEKQPKTAVGVRTVKKLFQGINTIPEGFEPLPKARKLLANSEKLFTTGVVDWAMAELLAYASLLNEGHDIRMSGQDCKRGTFSHRHATLHDAKTHKEMNRLHNISDKQGEFRIYDSLLSEFGVLGFEFGYSMASPEGLNIWEAQFGDFANGAQTIIDQFITSSQSKWQRMSGLVLLLPHGYEGQGPEHSSARLERFLQACAEFNIVVANVTTPANFFHLMRRQLNWSFRKPLVVMSPKSLLRHPECRSEISELSSGSFQPLIPDTWCYKSGKKIRRILLCSGKIYYDLRARQMQGNHKDVALIRLEQLYPLPLNEIIDLLNHYTEAEVCWVQEEPANMGAWTYMLNRFPEIEWYLISRKSSASPATGFAKVHNNEQESILSEAFAD
jgi:2-oxoglutarate dehydrogenase E1 component